MVCRIVFIIIYYFSLFYIARKYLKQTTLLSGFIKSDKYFLKKYNINTINKIMNKISEIMRGT